MAEKEMLNILFAASEVFPFAKTGGLADVASALPKALAELGCAVKVIMPLYSKIDEIKYDLKYFCDLPNGGAIKKSRLRGSAVEYYFVEYAHYFGRNSLYGENGSDFTDNAERFIFFSKAVLDFARLSGVKPDIIHCNDWQTALVPVYLSLLRADTFFKNTGTVLTVHNLAYQGIFNKQTMYASGLPWDYFTRDKLEYWDQVNFMKGGLVFADILNTVSETYARQIQADYDYGWGLEGVLRNRKNDLFGILNGIDSKEWNPETDKYILIKYGHLSHGKKLENKKKLAERCSLPFRPETPLLGIVSRFAAQKGFDIIGAAMDSLMQNDIQLVVQGMGDKRYNDMFLAYREKYPDKLAVVFRYDERIAHLIYAGSDMFLMPSRFEPCGLSQLISFKYGTIPIVRATGGLADSVKDYAPKNGAGTGFVFREYSPLAMLEAVKRALEAYKNKNSWAKLVVKAMKLEFSWADSAKKYIKLYKKAQEKHK
jgi:starch synthase